MVLRFVEFLESRARTSLVEQSVKRTAVGVVRRGPTRNAEAEYHYRRALKALELALRTKGTKEEDTQVILLALRAIILGMKET